MNVNSKIKVAVFGGGCFWCTEAVFSELKGVMSVVSGYAGGEMKNPTYEDVSSGKTGHVEVVKVEYDPKQISYSDLLTVFFAMHDPTTLNQQVNDIGTQYRSMIFYTTENQKKEAETFIQKLKESGIEAVTEIKPLNAFYVAENYHQKYYLNNTSAPYCKMVIDPKLDKLRVHFRELLKSLKKENKI